MMGEGTDKGTVRSRVTVRGTGTGKCTIRGKGTGTDRVQEQLGV